MGLLSRILRKQTPQERVWEWLFEHEETLIYLIKHGGELNDYDWSDIQARLKAVHPTLAYQLLPPDDVKGWTLYLTVNGAPDAEQVLNTMLAYAPQFKHCSVIAGLPAQDIEALDSPGFGISLSVADMYFNVYTEHKTPRFDIFVPQLATEGMEELVHRVLFYYLGEYPFLQLLPLMTLCPVGDASRKGCRPLADLREVLAQMRATSS